MRPAELHSAENETTDYKSVGRTGHRPMFRRADEGLCRTTRVALESRMSSLQAQIEQRGLQVFDLVDQNPESIFSKAGFYQRMMAFSMRDEVFKVQMFRFVDVLASLRRSTDIVQHLNEYFAGMRNGSVPFLQTGIRAARIFPWLTAPILRWNVSGMARQFIAGRDPEDVMKMLRKRRKERIGFTVDLLGEAVVSEQEANEYAERCFNLLDGLAQRTRGWTDPLLASFPEHFHHVLRIAAGDELPRHAGDVPA